LEASESAEESAAVSRRAATATAPALEALESAPAKERASVSASDAE
jgi:hypothetical protein